MMANPSVYSRLFGVLTCGLLLCLAGCGKTPSPAGSADKQAKPPPQSSPHHQDAPKTPSKPAATSDTPPAVTAPSPAEPAIPVPSRKIEITHETVTEEHVEKPAAEDAPAAPPAGKLTWNEDLKEAVTAVEKIRGKKFIQAVPGRHQTLEDFEKFVRAELAKEFPPDKLAGMMRGLVRLGVIKQPFDFGENMINALLTQAGAYYNPETDTFYMLYDDLPSFFEKSFQVHELTHALQDQRHDLGELMKRLEARQHQVRNDDRVLAARYLIEGEATYVESVFQMRQMGLTVNDQIMHIVLQDAAKMNIEQLMKQTKALMLILGLFSKGLQRMAGAIDAADSIPPYILVPLMDAYLRGAVYVSRLRLQGGWKAVDAAFKNLPESVEQCLHPARQNDKPTRLKLPPFAYLTAAGWQPVDAAIHGEMYLALLLKNVGADDATARAATAGWDGDIYRAYAKGERVMVVLATTWDDAREAKEYYAAHSRGLKKKGYQGTDIENEDGGRRFVFTCGKPTDTGLMLLRGREVFLVEGADQATCKKVMRDLKAMKIKYRK